MIPTTRALQAPGRTPAHVADVFENPEQTISTQAPDAGWVLRWVLSGAAVLYLVFVIRTAFTIGGVTYFTLGDDAMISMRYAQHLAAGQGIVWNIGESPIEGYTNFTWMLLMAVLHWAGLPDRLVSLPMMLVSGLVLLATAAATSRVTREIGGDRVAAVVAATCVAFFFPLVYWSLRGFEVGASTLVAVLASLTAIRLVGRFEWNTGLAFAFLCVLGVTIRLDFIAQILVMVAFLALGALLQRRMVVFAGVVAAIGAGLAAFALFKLWYFGDVFPNTYYLKLTGASLMTRAKEGLWVFVDVAWEDIGIVVAGTAGAFLAFPRLITKPVVMLAGLFATQIAYSIYSGGDYNEYDVGGANRFITQGMPFLFILFGVGVAELLRRAGVYGTPDRSGSWRLAAVPLFIGAATIAITSGDEWFKWGVGNAPELGKEIRRVEAGLLIRSGTDDSAIIAVHAAGQIPYFARRTALDLFGKSDPVVAKGPSVGPFRPGHNKFNLDYHVGQLKPDIVVVGVGGGGPLDPRPFLRGRGYRESRGDVWIRCDTQKVHSEAFGEGVGLHGSQTHRR